MLFPTNDFKKAVKCAFYDKEIGVRSVEIVTNNEGQRKKVLGDIKRTFKGNAQFSNRKVICEEYGLKEDFDLSITADELVELNDVLEYQGVNYTVTDVLKFDTHNLIVAVKYVS